MALTGFVNDITNKVCESNLEGTTLDKLELGRGRENFSVDSGMRVVGASQNVNNQENVASLRGK
eukprot:4732479-Pyramimonas_sp.AAC.1